MNLVRVGSVALPGSLRVATGVFISFRPWQWTKNLLVFLPLVFSMGERWSIDELGLLSQLLLRSIIGFLIFCALSGGVYIINDVFDREQDRVHPRKRRRPIASGRVPLPVAEGAAVLLFTACLTGSFLMGTGIGIVTLLYLIINLGYSAFMKRVIILDVMTLSVSYLMRVVAGALIIDVITSPWLYTTIGLGALFIGLGKRYNELQAAEGNAPSQRSVLSQYTLPLLSQLIIITCTATLVAYALYTFSASNVPPNKTMMLTLPFVIYGLFRYLYLINHTTKGESPEILIIKDPPLLLTISLWAITAIVILALNR